MTPKPTGPLPVIVTLDEIIQAAKRAFLDTQRDMSRTARQKIDGDATNRTVDAPEKTARP